MDKELEKMQHQAGQKLVKRCFWFGGVFFVGWALLWHIAADKPSSWEMMQWETKGEISHFADEERDMARTMCYGILAAGMMIFVALVVVTIWASLHY